LSLRAQIVRLLTSHRLSLADEKALQREIAGVLEASDIAFQREFRLSGADIVDFMVGDLVPIEAGIAIEVKIKGGKRNIYRQIERYCAHPAVREIVLATNVPMMLPPEIGGKPATVAMLARGWL
jgi:hypothetical protein